MKKVRLFCMALLALLCFSSCGPSTNGNIYSSTVRVYQSDWYWDDTSWRVDINYDAIDMNVNDYGAVLVYMKFENTWRQIPATFYYTVIENAQTLYCSSSLEVSSYNGGVSIFWTENDFYNGRVIGDHDFKIVVIAASLYNARQDVDYSDFNAVKTAFQLAD